MSLCPPQILSCLGRWRIEKCPFPSWLTPLGVFHWTVTELQWPASHFLGISALAGNSKEVTGYFGLPWGAGAEAGSELPTPPPALRSPLPVSPTHGPSPGEPRRGAACPGLAGLRLERDIKVSPGMCVALPRCERDTEPGIMKEILRWLSPHQIKGKLSVRLANNTCYCSSPVRHFIKRYNHFNIHASPQPFHPPPLLLLYAFQHIPHWKVPFLHFLGTRFPSGQQVFHSAAPRQRPSPHWEKGIFSWSFAALSPRLLPSTTAPFSFK